MFGCRHSLRSRLRTFAPLVLAALVGGRVVLACSDDEASPEALGDGGDAADARGSTGGGATDGAPTDGGPVAPPSFCDGIVFLATFDQGAKPDFGGGRARPGDTSLAFAQGRFGNGLSLTTEADAATAVFYDRDAGAPGADGGSDAATDASAPVILPQTEGSLAFWFRRTVPDVGNPQSFVRPYGAGNSVVGLAVARLGSSFGLYTDFGGAPVLVFSDINPFLRDSEFDHYAVAWRRANPDAGVGPLARLVVNGGSGEVFADGGYDASAYADASPDDAGNLRVPYRAQTTAPWDVDPGPLYSLRLGGVPGTAPQGTFDDFVVWDRALSFDEMAAVYASASAGSVRTVCKL